MDPTAANGPRDYTLFDSSHRCSRQSSGGRLSYLFCYIYVTTLDSVLLAPCNGTELSMERKAPGRMGSADKGSVRAVAWANFLNRSKAEVLRLVLFQRDITSDFVYRGAERFKLQRHYENMEPPLIIICSLLDHRITLHELDRSLIE